MTGALIGLGVGAMVGAALFGGAGALVGGVLGLAFGIATIAIFSIGHAEVSASMPRVVQCPETRERRQVTLDAKQARWTPLTLQRPRVSGCDRWEGEPECDRACEERIAVQ